MKKWNCDTCGKEIEVKDDYASEYCCSGLAEGCGCIGKPINPVFCDECEKKIFGMNSHTGGLNRKQRRDIEFGRQ